jgi:hypothetical protein
MCIANGKAHDYTAFSCEISSRKAVKQKQLVVGFPAGRPGFHPSAGHAGIEVDKVAMGLIFTEHFGFPANSPFTNCFIS